MIKIVHTADLHLGSKFQGLSEEKQKIRQKELIECFDDIITIVKEEQADVLLIAGDLFDHTGVQNIAKYTNTRFGELTNTQVCIAAGNHDPKQAVYDKIEWNKNVHIFDGALSYIEVNGVRIYGASFLSAGQTIPLLHSISNSDTANILVMHGDIGSGSYNPMEPELLKQFDYAALGHVHKHSGIVKSGVSAYGYSGFAEPRGFDEQGKGGIIIGSVAKGYVDLERRILSRREYIECFVDISECADNLDIIDKIQEILRPNDIFRVTLTGHNSTFPITEDYIVRCLEIFCFDLAIIYEQSIDYSLYANSYSLKGLFVKKMLTLIEKAPDEEKEVYRRAMVLGMEAMEKSGV